MSNKSNLVYPIILELLSDGGYCVTVPDMDCHTQGDDLADALYMAKDAIEMMGVFLQDEGKTIPPPSDIGDIEIQSDEIKTLVTVNFDEYRRKTESKLVKKTLSLPSWLNARAESAGINFSATLQDALKTKLGIGA